MALSFTEFVQTTNSLKLGNNGIKKAQTLSEAWAVSFF